ncbi:helix-turn-helix domain-containing protein [Mucilaginibacter glaciei]|uniref:Helix-turn-helix transcriptional regulator n=1 Tax=Mucilaginibacter glaciei TaxID=2772109 RepID=A0A926NU70_9SPHI|nr:AraC family transcriptional regulator [Mucilaginibacter glaciei]MBD1395072.1 helix-turn-helix transcriptional regulator [Mucilaginibacter glaciei]
MNSIPVDQLQNKTSIGLQVKTFKGNDESPQNQSYDNHRDDHYIFFILKKGSGKLHVDFQDVVVTAGHIYFIIPTQIHSRVKTDHAEGWFLAVDPALIAIELQAVFENRLNLQPPCKLSEYELKQYDNLLCLLYNEYTQRKGDQYYLSIIHALTHSFLGMAASNYSSLGTIEYKHSRSADLARKFKKLLSLHIRTVKSPSAYASMLNISSGYLNEAIKGVTGSTVSYWIQHETFTEAKRLLYHSDADVKEIAFELGFSDYSYFIRSFKKVCGFSPSKFRTLNRR